MNLEMKRSCSDQAKYDTDLFMIGTSITGLCLRSRSTAATGTLVRLAVYP